MVCFEDDTVTPVVAAVVIVTEPLSVNAAVSMSFDVAAEIVRSLKIEAPFKSPSAVVPPNKPALSVMVTVPVLAANGALLSISPTTGAGARAIPDNAVAGGCVVKPIA